MRVPKALINLIESFQKLPGIGPKTAQRLGFYLLHVPESDLQDFGNYLQELKKNTMLCSVCMNVAESEVCDICLDTKRDRDIIMVVEQPLDVFAFERSGKYRGLYHVLHGAISPLENIGPDEIHIDSLIHRLTNGEKTTVAEILIGTNPTMEGDATAMYLVKRLKELSDALKISRLGMGIPTGADLEYADDITLTQAIEGRREL